MSEHIDRMRRAIEFGRPDCVPMELVDVPFLYNAYGTKDETRVVIPAGADAFDSAWCTYHWTFESLGRTPAGEPLRRDEWGCTQIVPHDQSGAYVVTDRPRIECLDDALSYPWPDPAKTDGFFVNRQAVIEQHYSDRFICGFIDPGPFLIAFNLFGYDGLLMNLADNLDLVTTVIGKICDYQLALVPKFKAMGAHMINLIDEVAGTGGMMFAPDLWRRHFKPFYDTLFKTIHRHNLYASCLLDGNITDILPDLMAMELDQLFFAQPHATGIDTIADFCRGKRCVKMAVDMMETFASGTPEQVAAEVDAMVEKIRTEKGGLVFQALRWHRPEYAAARVRAQIDAMNKYRKGAG